MEGLESSDYNFGSGSLTDLQESEKSTFSSRRTSLSQDDNRPSKKLKSGRPKQSFVWNYFVTIENINYCQVQMEVSSKYPNGVCNHKVENGSTTTNMINHLKKVHNIMNQTEQEMVNILFIFSISNML